MKKKTNHKVFNLKISLGLFFGLLIGITILIFLFCNNINSNAWTTEIEIQSFEQRIFSHATIDEDFCDNSVLVTLDRNISRINKIHNDSFFGSFEKKYIKDMLRINNPTVRNLINEKEFRQVLLIRLPKNCKKNVLQTISTRGRSNVLKN